MYINYNTVGGIEYGTATSSVRAGKKARKGNQIYLGRVIDKEHGIFKSRKRGLFVYDIDTNTFRSVPPDYEMPKIQRKKKYTARPTLIVSFGDIFLLDEYLKRSGPIKAIDAIGYRNPDTCCMPCLLIIFLHLLPTVMRKTGGGLRMQNICIPRPRWPHSA